MLVSTIEEIKISKLEDSIKAHLDKLLSKKKTRDGIKRIEPNPLYRLLFNIKVLL